MSPILVVWVESEQTYGEVVSEGAFFSIVSYFKSGIEYRVAIENTELEIIGVLGEYNDLSGM